MNNEFPAGFAPPAATPQFGPGSSNYTKGVEKDTMEHLGTIAMRQSLLFRPTLYMKILIAVMNLIPKELLPRNDDTPELLAQRISQCALFDELEALTAGGQCGKKRTRLNETTYSQPRRVSWSVVAEDLHLNDEYHLVRTMYAYGKPNSRIRTGIIAVL